MLEYLPKELREHLDIARKRQQRRRSKMRVELGDALVYPVLRFWRDGFSLDAGLVPARLRGFVDLYDGPRHVFQCLIVASEVQDGELVCEFKRATPVSNRAPLDYWRGGDEGPAGYLPSA
ncbi:hypothetical protein HOY34_04915 [Xinfangfangia sp. D13-10-4-6]|uniref:hypothetical protein n=1 Tax=Pseudogemmobacter hezensis TaxID=2737662 RepID=UPI00155729C9|nr:hypothetical protein [Pseudogemmobacter hezensis]NPD14542.1 hypothetical protein [Pseudogemmobacter hezensis]